VKAYAPSAIQISPDRQRQEFEAQALEELKSSIEDRGLMHAPVVRDTPAGPVLVAGERRLRAISDLFALGSSFLYNGVRYTETIPTVSLGELSPLDAEEAELDENLKRKDLTWQELANAHARLHKLRVEQVNAKAMMDAKPGEPVTPAVPHTIADTAKEVMGSSEGWNQDVIRKEVIVSKHLDKPEVAKAKTLDEAWKILKRSEKAEENRMLAAKVGATFTAEAHRLFKGHCLKVMQDLFEKDERFDVILTDPPYGMGADTFGDGGKDLPSHQYNDSHEAWQELMGGNEAYPTGWAKWSYAITKSEAHAYVFCDIDRFHELKEYMEKAGWYVFRTPLIDYKTDSGRVPLPDRGPRRQWEMILYAIKGNKPVTHIYPDVIPCQADPNMTHGAQKPVALYANLLKRSVKPGDLVLDTFAGSGTIFPAAHSLQCTATGIEQEAEYYGMCLSRLKALKTAADPLSELMEGAK
jgi:DNA modification methylase/ParB-like chromosome segregation protein Spo0J